MHLTKKEKKLLMFIELSLMSLARNSYKNGYMYLSENLYKQLISPASSNRGVKMVAYQHKKEYLKVNMDPSIPKNSMIIIFTELEYIDDVKYFKLKKAI